MNPLLFKLGDSVRRIQRNWPHPILNKIWSFEPIPVKSQHPTRLLIMTPPNGLAETAWAAWSWLTFLPHELELWIGIDGHAPHAELDRLKKLFPGAQIHPASELGKPFAALSVDCERFMEQDRFGRKTAAVYAMQQEAHLLASDYDLLCFEHPSFVSSCLERHDTFHHAYEQGSTFHDPLLLKKGQALGAPPLMDFNAGLLFIPHGRVTGDFTRAMFAGWTPETAHWCSDQTFYASAALLGDHEPFPPERYVTNSTGQFFWNRQMDERTITVRHYIGQVRHLMYTRGMPLLLARTNGERQHR